MSRALFHMYLPPTCPDYVTYPLHASCASKIAFCDIHNKPAVRPFKNKLAKFKKFNSFKYRV